MKPLLCLAAPLAGLLPGCLFHPPPPLAEELPAERPTMAAPAGPQGGAGDAAAAQAPPAFAPGEEPELGMDTEEIRAYARAQGDPEGGDFTLEEALAGLPGDGPLWAHIVMDRGTLTCELLPELAPVTVANFVGLARGLRPYRDPSTGTWVQGPYYDGTEFHRVIMGFMIQGGDRSGTGTGDTGYVIADEFSPQLRYDRPGLLGMANRGPTTGSAQFFITLAPTPHLDDKHTIFGRCTEASVKLAEDIAVSGGEGDRPKTPQVMKRVEIVRGPVADASSQP